MDKLSLQSTCPKCGYGTYEGEWRSNITMRYIPQIDLPSPDCIGQRKIIYGSDNIERRCPRCGHKWSETCLDAEGENMLGE